MGVTQICKFQARLEKEVQDLRWAVVRSEEKSQRAMQDLESFRARMHTSGTSLQQLTAENSELTIQVSTYLFSGIPAST